MSARATISRRAFASSLALLALARQGALAQGFAGLAANANDFAQVTPGKSFSFPADHGPHPDFRIEWWYVNANLADRSGASYGVQWTLFRQAMQPGPQREGWANQQIFMAHVAATRAHTHRFSESFARDQVKAGEVKLLSVEGVDLWRELGLCYRRDRSLPRAVQALIALIREHRKVPEHAGAAAH